VQREQALEAARAQQRRVDVAADAARAVHLRAWCEV
jgi:hypothetical protein